MGAPNLILGRSQSGNISCKDAVDEELVDILCSDYHFPAMLSSAIKLFDNGMKLNNAIKYITLNPAKLLEIDFDYGSIDIGKIADFIIFNIVNNQPYINQVYLSGELKYNCRKIESSKVKYYC